MPQTNGLRDRWTAAARGGSTVNVTQDMSEVTLEVVLRALFGDDLDRLDPAAGDNPFALLTDHTARNLAFAYKFRAAGQADHGTTSGDAAAITCGATISCRCSSTRATGKPASRCRTAARWTKS